MRNAILQDLTLVFPRGQDDLLICRVAGSITGHAQADRSCNVATTEDCHIARPRSSTRSSTFFLFFPRNGAKGNNCPDKIPWMLLERYMPATAVYTAFAPPKRAHAIRHANTAGNPKARLVNFERVCALTKCAIMAWDKSTRGLPRFCIIGPECVAPKIQFLFFTIFYSGSRRNPTKIRRLHPQWRRSAGAAACSGNGMAAGGGGSSEKHAGRRPEASREI